MSTLYKLLLKKRQVTRQVSAKKNKYHHTFIASTIRDWNSLPNRVVEEQSVEALKKAARCHVSKNADPIINLYSTRAPYLIFLTLAHTHLLLL